MSFAAVLLLSGTVALRFRKLSKLHKYIDQFRQLEEEHGVGYVARQMALNENDKKQ